MDRLEFDDFYDRILGHIPDFVISETYIGYNSQDVYEFMSNIYRIYQMDSNPNLSVYTKIIESTVLLFKNNAKKWIP